MRVLVVGASGVIGRELLPRLVAAGHEVVGTSRSREGARRLTGDGVTGETLDVDDAAGTAELLRRVRPDALVSEVTDLPDSADDLPAKMAANSRLRREAVPALVAAARDAGVPRILVQSVAWDLDEEGNAAVAAMEDATLAAGGVALRYGQFYGPGTFHDERPDGPAVSLAHAADRTVAALDAPSGVVTVTD